MSLAKGFIVFLAVLAAGLAAVWFFVVRKKAEPTDEPVNEDTGISSTKATSNNAAMLTTVDKVRAEKADVGGEAAPGGNMLGEIGLGSVAFLNVQAGGAQLATALPGQVIAPVNRTNLGAGASAQSVATHPDLYSMKEGSTVATPTDPLLKATAKDDYGRFVLPTGLPSDVVAAATKKIIDFQTAVNGGFAPTYWDGTPAYDAQGNKLPEPANTSLWNAYVERGKDRGHTAADMEKMSHIIDANRAAAGLEAAHTWGY
jgi:hypothetical protein